ncbi:MAG TPA: nitroreductase/quinone reductase family protein [Anaerolineales bacterium]|nr:nitroreductase/quinone reductase family protein [Anaerolineales bacterium]
MGTTKKYSWIHSLVQKVAASKTGAWISSHILHHVDRIVFRLSGHRATFSSLIAGVPVVMLTSKGAKSGLLRTVPLLCIRDENDPASFALIATNWGQKSYPAWYYNLKANPEAVCSIAGKARGYLAHEAQGEEYERFWQYASNIYFGYPLYKQRIAGRSIPIMVMKEIDK